MKSTNRIHRKSGTKPASVQSQTSKGGRLNHRVSRECLWPALMEFEHTYRKVIAVLNILDDKYQDASITLQDYELRKKAFYRRHDAGIMILVDDVADELERVFNKVFAAAFPQSAEVVA